MKAEETRLKLMNELHMQFSKTDAISNPISNKVVNDVTLNTDINIEKISLGKPKMFIPKEMGRLEIVTGAMDTPVRGLGFKNTTDEFTKISENQEIYSMKELINTNPENMVTLTFDESVVKAQLALVKKKEWQDILFEDVDWFMKIDIASGLKKLFRIS